MATRQELLDRIREINIEMLELNARRIVLMEESVRLADEFRQMRNSEQFRQVDTVVSHGRVNMEDDDK